MAQTEQQRHELRKSGMALFVMMRKSHEHFEQYPREVVHDVGKRVWVWSDHAEELPEGVVQVGDALTNGYDATGIRLISIPEDQVEFMTEEDAASIAACMAVDEAMLANAI